jgi:hypothetical protein
VVVDNKTGKFHTVIIGIRLAGSKFFDTQDTSAKSGYSPRMGYWPKSNRRRTEPAATSESGAIDISIRINRQPVSENVSDQRPFKPPSASSKQLLPWLVAVAFFMESLDTTPAIASTMQQMSVSFGVAAAGLTTALFIPVNSSSNSSEMIHGLYEEFLVLGGFTILFYGHLQQIEKRGWSQ